MVIASQFSLFWLLLCIVGVLLLSGFVYAAFYIRKKNEQPIDTPALKVTKNGLDSHQTTEQVFVEVPVRYREVFVQTMEQDLSILNQALDEGRVRAILSMLHRMHGALAAVSMTEFAERCELLGQRGSLYGMDDELKKDINKLARDLMRMVQWQHTI